MTAASHDAWRRHVTVASHDGPEASHDGGVTRRLEASCDGGVVRRWRRTTPGGVVRHLEASYDIWRCRTTRGFVLYHP